MKNWIIFLSLGGILIGFLLSQKYVESKLEQSYLDTLIIRDTIRLKPVVKYLQAKRETVVVRVIDSILNDAVNKDSLITELITPFSVSDSTNEYNIYIKAIPIENMITYKLNIMPIPYEKMIIQKEEKSFDIIPYITGVGIGIFIWEIIR